MLVIIALFCSIRFAPTDCVSKNGSIIALNMLTKMNVDVIFGPGCSPGSLTNRRLVVTFQTSSVWCVPILWFCLQAGVFGLAWLYAPNQQFRYKL